MECRQTILYKLLHRELSMSHIKPVHGSPQSLNHACTMTLVVVAEDVHAQTNLALLIVVMASIFSACTANQTPRTDDLKIAIREMQTATYFSFVMLINMFPPNRIPRNVTFLMPNDRMLSQISLSEDSVYNFLLRHSIPTPLLFDHLEHFPTGSMIPTSEPDFKLKISNNGRRQYYLNNVQIMSPNICTAGSSIRCHGIKGVLEPAKTGQAPACAPPHPNTEVAPVSPKNPSASASPETATAPASPTSPTLPPKSPLTQISFTAPPPINLSTQSKKSDSPQLVALGLFHSVIPCIIIALVTF